MMMAKLNSTLAADATGRIGGAYAADQCLCLIGKFEGLTPGLKVIMSRLIFQVSN